MTDSYQFSIVQIGILIGQDDSSLDIDTFENLEELRIYLNLVYDIEITVGMLWPDVIKILKTSINDKRFNASMEIL